jgi:replication-associated recombination protein RarA
LLHCAVNNAAFTLQKSECCGNLDIYFKKIKTAYIVLRYFTAKSFKEAIMYGRSHDDDILVSVLERYQPDTLKEVMIADATTRQELEGYIKHKSRTGKVLLFGKEGVGKSTIAKVLCAERLGVSSSTILVEQGKWKDDLLKQMLNTYYWAQSTGETPVVIVEAVELLKHKQGDLSDFMDAYKNSVLFILTAHDLGYVSAPIANRSDMFHICGFSVEKSVVIARHYLRREGVFTSKRMLQRIFTECLAQGETELTMRNIGVALDELIRQSFSSTKD